MAAKKILNFLVLRPAFSARNITSIALVGVFFMVYYLAGGRIQAVPKIESGATFGSVRSQDRNLAITETTEENTILDAAREDSPRRILDQGRDTSSSAQPNTILNADDELSDIEQRLQRLPARRGGE